MIRRLLTSDLLKSRLTLNTCTLLRTVRRPAPYHNASSNRKTSRPYGPSSTSTSNSATSGWPSWSSLTTYTKRLILFQFNLFLIGHLVVTYLYTVRPTGGPSMLPTMAAEGGWVVISLMHKRGHGIKIGDLVSYDIPVRQGFRGIKRVVGMPGDFVVRDTPKDWDMEEAMGTEAEKRNAWMVQVPEGHCWITGDNLEWSRDSRMFGPLPLALIKGKVIARAWPWPMKYKNPFDDEP